MEVKIKLPLKHKAKQINEVTTEFGSVPRIGELISVDVDYEGVNTSRQLRVQDVVWNVTNKGVDVTLITK